MTMTNTQYLNCREEIRKWNDPDTSPSPTAVDSKRYVKKRNKNADKTNS